MIKYEANNPNLKNSLRGPSWPSVSSPLKEMMGVVLKQKPGLLTAFRALWSRSLLLTWMWVSTSRSMFSCLNSLRMESRSSVNCAPQRQTEFKGRLKRKCCPLCLLTIIEFLGLIKYFQDLVKMFLYLFFCLSAVGEINLLRGAGNMSLGLYSHLIVFVQAALRAGLQTKLLPDKRQHTYIQVIQLCGSLFIIFKHFFLVTADGFLPVHDRCPAC